MGSKTNDISLYNSIRDKIETGDLLLFSSDDFIGNLIKDSTSSKYSHVGIAVWGIQPGTTDDKRLFILESTTLNIVKDISGEFRRGVQMVLASQKLESFDGMAFWQSFKVPLIDEQKQAACNWAFQKYTSKVDYDYRDAIGAGINDPNRPWWAKLISIPIGWFYSKPKEDLTKLFCSEFVTKFLEIAGKVNPVIDSSIQTPDDCSEFDCMNQPPIRIL